jgi:hypothetical protein
MQFGFRALSKARWDELDAEYLAYRTRILADIAPAEPDVPAPSAFPEPKRRVSPVRDIVAPPPTNMSYPQNCLVFVRNIHPETNKTTLRTFFAKAVEVKEAIDYVDFNKGMDSVRFFFLAFLRAEPLLTRAYVVLPAINDRRSRKKSRGALRTKSNNSRGWAG